MKNQKRRKEERLDEFKCLCRARGIPLTVQRRVVLEALLDREDHPTADQIYDMVRVRIPGVSRATVYRVLETLVRMGVASRVSHLGPAVRFEPNMGQHHHLVCTRCGRITDFEDRRLNRLPVPDVRQMGFEITDYSVHFRGLCVKCRRERTT